MSIPRWVNVPGAYNVRDLGGYRTKNGKTTRWRTFLRADSLHNLPESSKNKLIAYGVRTVVDLRRTHETVDAPNTLASVEGVEYLHMNIIGDTYPPGYGPPWSDRESTVEWTLNTYRVLLDRRQEVIYEALVALAGSKGHTAIFHCTAGTDRTGIIAALLLGLAGVPDNTIVEDYALSTHGLRRRFLDEEVPEYLTGKDLNSPLILAPPIAMERTLQHLKDEYGGVESYVKHIGLTDTQIADIQGVLSE